MPSGRSAEQSVVGEQHLYKSSFSCDKPHEVGADEDDEDDDILFLNTQCTNNQNIKADFEGPLPTKNIRSRADVWYTFTPLTDGNYLFNSHADFADAISVFSGTCDSLYELVSDYSGQSILLNGVLANQTYYIQVSGYFSTLEGHMCGEISQKNEEIAEYQNSNLQWHHNRLMDSILLFIGKREAGLPPKEFTENEKINLRQMAVFTILVAAAVLLRLCSCCSMLELRWIVEAMMGVHL